VTILLHPITKHQAIIPMTTNLPKWLDSGGHLKIQLAQLTRLCVCTLDPLL